MLKNTLALTKIFIGAIALFLVLFGIHWIAILGGLVLGGVYFLIPRRYLH